MFTISFIFYIFGIFLTYVSVRNFLSFKILFLIWTFPAAVSAYSEVFYIMSLAAFFFGMGAFAYNTASFASTKKLLINYRNQKFEMSYRPGQAFISIIFLLSVIFIGASIFYFYSVGISLFGDEVGFDRLVNRHAVSGSYIYQRIFRVFLPIICLVYFCMGYSESYKKYYKRLIFILLVLISFLFLVFTGMRGNTLIFMFFPFLVLFGYLPSGTSSFLLILRITFVTFISGMIVSKAMYPELPLSELLLLIFARVTTGATDGISYMVTIDVPINGFYFGETYFNDFMSLFSKLGLTFNEYMTYGSYLAQSMLGDRYNNEQASIFFSGELFANFGYPGVIVGSFIVGALLQAIYLKTLKTRKDVVLTPILSYFSALFLAILGGPTISMLLDYFITIFSFIILLFPFMLFTSIKYKRFIFLNMNIRF